MRLIHLEQLDWAGYVAKNFFHHLKTRK